ncbi:hypothetical protein BFL35_09410 [Clavibacter michiganensis]|nr:hypothetical protein BFL35_09410 [Clavibacter michiganensis]
MMTKSVPSTMGEETKADTWPNSPNRFSGIVRAMKISPATAIDPNAVPRPKVAPEEMIATMKAAVGPCTIGRRSTRDDWRIVTSPVSRKQAWIIHATSWLESWREDPMMLGNTQMPVRASRCCTPKSAVRAGGSFSSKPTLSRGAGAPAGEGGEACIG